MELTLKVLSRIADVDEAAWNGLLPPHAPPLVKWRWIHALEDSKSAVEKTGWEPHHLTLWQGETLVAASPAYRKYHSMGEYIYDFNWAGAADQLGVAYYPKLWVGVPLSPATAPRYLVKPGEDAGALREVLFEASLALAKEGGCSGTHVVYVPDEDVAALDSRALAHRLTLQFHWKNPGYASYEDFLSRFSSKRRNQLKRERGAAAQQGIHVETVTGAALTPEHARLAFRFYEATVRRKGWGGLQLNRGFFDRVFEWMPEEVELVTATHAGRVIAGAFNLVTAERLYGRYWGCFEDVPFLHFNVCFYHSIDTCIRAGRKVFEPGAGGEHKIARGFEPSAVHSLHKLFDPRLHQAIAGFVRRESRVLGQEVEGATETTGMKPWTGPATGPALALGRDGG